MNIKIVHRHSSERRGFLQGTKEWLWKNRKTIIRIVMFVLDVLLKFFPGES